MAIKEHKEDYIYIYREFGSGKKWKKLSKKESIKLELGSGPKLGKNGWTTIDIGYSDISWDLRKGIPLKNDSVETIYSSHLLEHIPYEDLIKFLKECYRVLKRNGEFSVCVPNFKAYVTAYMRGQVFCEREKWWKPAAIDTGSIIDQLNYMAYMKDEHKYMFDSQNLVNTFLKAGFSKVKMRSFDEEMDKKERDFESIYAIAYK